MEVRDAAEVVLLHEFLRHRVVDMVRGLLKKMKRLFPDKVVDMASWNDNLEQASKRNCHHGVVTFGKPYLKTTAQRLHEAVRVQHHAGADLHRVRYHVVMLCTWT